MELWVRQEILFCPLQQRQWKILEITHALLQAWRKLSLIQLLSPSVCKRKGRVSRLFEIIHLLMLKQWEYNNNNNNNNNNNKWSKRKGSWKDWKVSKSGQRTEKNVGSENQSHTNCIGGFRNSTTAIEGQLKGYRRRHINYFNPEVHTAGISKDTKKSNGIVKDRKKKHFGVPWQLVVVRHHNLTSCYKLGLSCRIMK